MVTWMESNEDSYSKFNSDYDFAVWCFGDVWVSFLEWESDTIDLLNSWNERHGELLLLHPDDAVAEAMEKMKQLWRQHGDKSKA